MQDNPTSRPEYIRRILEIYRTTPTTTGHIRRPDRTLAGQLYDQGVPFAAVVNALALAAARRIFRPEDAPPHDPVRSLHYFRDVIDEVMRSTVSEDYFEYLRRKIDKHRDMKTSR
jgi:hypothetical protein